MKVITPNIVCLSAKLQRPLFVERVMRNFSPKQPKCNHFDSCLFFAFLRLSMFRSACVCVRSWRKGRGPHVCNDDSYTAFGKNKHLKRPIYIQLQGSFTNQSEVHLSTHCIFFPIWDYKVVRLCQESSRCSAEGVRAVCVRKKAKICDSRVKWVGVGK